MIRARYCGLFVLLMVMLTAVAASAQDQRRVGVVAAHPASFGVLWQVTDGFALRADGSFDWSTIGITSHSVGSRGGVGAALFF